MQLEEIMKLTKTQMILIYDNVADYEGHNWTKEEAAKQIRRWCEEDAYYAKMVRCIIGGMDATECYSKYLEEAMLKGDGFADIDPDSLY